jgi:hypothetical protein
MAAGRHDIAHHVRRSNTQATDWWFLDIGLTSATVYLATGFGPGVVAQDV